MGPLPPLSGEKAKSVFYDDFQGMLTHTVQHFFVIAIIRGLFKTQSNIYDKAFLRKWLTAIFA